MSHVHDGQATCSLCMGSFDLAHAKPILTAHPLRTRDVYECPNCGYYVPIVRPILAA